jgi:hypothetical protein
MSPCVVGQGRPPVAALLQGPKNLTIEKKGNHRGVPLQCRATVITTHFVREGYKISCERYG